MKLLPQLREKIKACEINDGWRKMSNKPEVDAALADLDEFIINLQKTHAMGETLAVETLLKTF